MGFLKSLKSKADFESALNGNAGKFVMVYVYEGTMDPRAEKAAELHQDKPVVSYEVDASGAPDAKAAFDLDTVPAYLVFKDGSEIKRIYNPDEAKMNELKSFMSSQ